MMKPFRNIYFEIAGFCNANCSYCHTGASKLRNGYGIDEKVLRDALTALLRNRIIRSGSVIRLYNWGEPFLHPKINDILDCVRKLGLKYAFSTNGSVVPPISADFVSALDHLIFSLPGFSQDSYDKIHGFNFEKIKGNIRNIVQQCRANGFNGFFKISFHVYKFNTKEIKECERFADELGIIFDPYFAILNHWWKLQDFISGNLLQEEKEKIKSELFLDNLQHFAKGRSKKCYCKQFNYLVIDELANVLTCCQIPSNHKDYSCGNILRDNMAEILANKKKKDVCIGCIDSGLSHYFNNAMKVPKFYRRSIKQNYLCFNLAARRVLI